MEIGAKPMGETLDLALVNSL